MIRAIEFYSGIGGINLALRRAGVNAEVVRAFDWDPIASQVYAENWGNITRRVDIARLTASDLASLDASLWLLSPACQPYTVLSASAKDAADPRAKSFLHLVETVLPDLAQQGAQPRWILLENVAGFENSITRQVLLRTMTALRYSTEEFLLTPLQFSIPNSRLRYYLLAKFHSFPFTKPAIHTFPHISRSIPGCGTHWTDPRGPTQDNTEPPAPLCPKLTEFLDSPKRQQEPGYWQAFSVPDKVLQNKGLLFDIVLPSSRRTCCFTRGYRHMVEGTSILQLNETLDTTTAFDVYAATLADVSNRMNILHALRLRYFTPEELLRLFHFCPTENGSSPNETLNTGFRWPAGISLKTKYRLIGNSVNVKVVQELLSYLLVADDSDS